MDTKQLFQDFVGLTRNYAIRLAHEDRIPNPDCCVECYQKYWSMVESGEISGDEHADHKA